MKKKYVLYILAIIVVVIVSIGATGLVRMAGRAAMEGVTGDWDARAAPTVTPIPAVSHIPSEAPSGRPSESPAVTAAPTALPEPESSSAGRRFPAQKGEIEAGDVANITTFWADVDGKEEEILESLARELPDFRPTSACRIEIRTDGKDDYAIIRPNGEEEYFLLIEAEDTGVSLRIVLPSDQKIKEVYTYGADIAAHKEPERGDGE